MGSLFARRPEPTKAKRVPGNLRRVLYRRIKWQDEYGNAGWARNPATLSNAEVVSSELVGSNRHAPVLDIDFHAELIPSSTEGHFHLYLDREMSWRKYKRFLKALAKAGVVEKGYVSASITRKHTAVRVPWLRKEV